MSRLRSFLQLSCALIALLGLGVAAHAQPTRIATGPDSGADGYLDVAPDEYGAWTQPFAGGPGPNDDNFNPAGAPGLSQVAFSSGFFLFAPGQRELLSDSADWQAALPADASLSRAVTSSNSASDFDGDGTDDTLRSSFEVTGGGTSLSFDLVQRVRGLGGGVATMRQQYTITNNGEDPISIVLVRAFDGDLLWDGDFSNDEVGTTMHAAGIGTYVFEQEAVLPGSTAITLDAGADGASYYGGKHGMLPGGVPPAYDFGTDTEVYDAFGIPANWVDHIAGVGYGTDGVSGVAPPGATPPEDGFIGVDVPLELEPGETRTIVVTHTYGAAGPASVTPCPGDTNGDGIVDVVDLVNVILAWDTNGQADGSDSDLNDDGNVDVTDLVEVILNWGPCPPCAGCGDLLDTLEDHLAAFAESTGIGPPSIIATGCVDDDVDTAALAQQWTDSTWVYDPENEVFVEITGPQEHKQPYIDKILLPLLESCAAWATLEWADGVETLAIVGLDATAGDTDAIQEPVTGWYLVEEPEPEPAANSFSKRFVNGFGSNAANYSASLMVVQCQPEIICPTVAMCQASDVGLGCSADCMSGPVTQQGLCCLASVAFVGYCGFPDVEFSAEDISFSVSGWGWQYYKATIPLDDCCDPRGACCVPDGGCIDTTAQNCADQGGAYQGDETDCGDTTCGPAGACCLQQGECVMATADECQAGGGKYQGDGTECGQVECQPSGACGPGSGPYDEANGTPGCDDIACCEAVCAVDPFCCDIEWDSACVQNAQKICQGG